MLYGVLPLKILWSNPDSLSEKQNLDINLDQALEKSNDKIASNEKLTLGENV